MQSRYFVALRPRPVNGLLNRTLRRTPTDDTDGSILISIAMWRRQFFGSRIELAEPFLHHRGMVFRLIIRMTILIMFQPGCNICDRPRPRCRNRGDAARSVGV